MLLISPAHVIIIIKASSIYSVGECSYHNITESHINTADPALFIELNLTYPNGYDVWRIARNLSLAAIHDGVESGEGAKFSVFSL